jgi:2-haloacid dehalogenase
MAGAAKRVYGTRLSPAAMADFIRSFSAYRLHEVLGAWKPYGEAVARAVERSCKRHGIPFCPEDAERIHDEVPSWGPHPDVPAGLAKVAKEIPLVILSNAMSGVIMSNVEKLGCGPEDKTHVSSSFRYDLITAYGLGIMIKVWVNRGHEPANPDYHYTEVKDIGALAAAVGLESARDVA